MADISPSYGEGNFLVCATLEGESTIGLEESVSRCSKEGKYPLDFGKVQTIPKGNFVIGVFEEPTIGTLRVSYFHSESPKYAISGSSYGPGIVEVMIDYARLIDLEQVTSPQSNMFFQALWHQTAAEEAILTTLREDTRREHYLSILQEAKDTLRGSG